MFIKKVRILCRYPHRQDFTLTTTIGLCLDKGLSSQGDHRLKKDSFKDHCWCTVPSIFEFIWFGFHRSRIVESARSVDKSSLYTGFVSSFLVVFYPYTSLVCIAFILNLTLITYRPFCSFSCHTTFYSLHWYPLSFQRSPFTVFPFLIYLTFLWTQLFRYQRWP